MYLVSKHCNIYLFLFAYVSYLTYVFSMFSMWLCGEKLPADRRQHPVIYQPSVLVVGENTQQRRVKAMVL